MSLLKIEMPVARLGQKTVHMTGQFIGRVESRFPNLLAINPGMRVVAADDKPSTADCHACGKG